MAIPTSGLQLRSIVKGGGELELSLVDTPVDAPAADEVLVRIEGTPINPSDLGLLLGAADMSPPPRRPDRRAAATVTATVPQHLMRAMAGRVDQSMPVGNEGAGVVIAAGSDPAAQALMGRTVAMIGGAMYGQYARSRRPTSCRCRPAPRPRTAPRASSIR